MGQRGGVDGKQEETQHRPLRHPRGEGVTTAAVCVYPSRVADAFKSLKAANSSLPVASVATGFPAGQTPLETRLQEVRMAVADGAAEIDVVINRTLVLTGQWEAMYDEIRQFRETCGDAHMKTILAIGELGTFTNVYKASLLAMMAGSDFIKTSTGKETVNATYPVAIVMVRAIRDYYLCTGHKVGFKPAGGIRTAHEALVWLTLIKEELGNDWLCPDLFRLGASSLLADIERQTDVLLAPASLKTPGTYSGHSFVARHWGPADSLCYFLYQPEPICPSSRDLSVPVWSVLPGFGWSSPLATTTSGCQHCLFTRTTRLAGRWPLSSLDYCWSTACCGYAVDYPVDAPGVRVTSPFTDTRLLVTS
ncbi:Deoxyribose-phosphate aldolase [Collichthys lucidus]|uniref:deoxyribose-phosphate aldolase n=1 Tax=Collichthys lucidus TaxID=240159 RepID=A0A4U5VDP1_COLLU|nr:Deoxyribose-phosphate aldolase [Collichthys lucidus]